MEITEQTHDVLVVHESPWTARAFGAGFIAMGAGALWLVTHAPRASVQGSPIVAWVVGSVFIGVGLLLLYAARDERVVFDRAAGVVRLMGKTITEYPLAAVRGVALEAQRGAKGDGLFYRPVLILSDGRHIPWISIATNNARGQAPAVAAAQAFGGWPSTVPGEAAGTTPVVGQPVPRGSFILAEIILGLIAMAAVAISGVEVYRIMTWRATAATVMSSTVQAVRGAKGGVSYRPEVSYWYRINGQEYVAAGVTPILISGGRGWAQSISARFTPGAAVTAYIDPGDPTRAYVVREFSPIPLWMLAIVIAVWGLLTWTIRRNGRTSAAVADDFGVPVVGTVQSVSPLR
jgi:Protein of unknown function (DUF3592)